MSYCKLREINPNYPVIVPVTPRACVHHHSEIVRCLTVSLGRRNLNLDRPLVEPVAMRLLFGCYAVAMRLLCCSCNCYVVAIRLLYGCYAVAMRLLCCSCCCCCHAVAMLLLLLLLLCGCYVVAMLLLVSSLFPCFFPFFHYSLQN